MKQITSSRAWIRWNVKTEHHLDFITLGTSIKRLQDLVLKADADIGALRCLILALIAYHPHPEQINALFQTIAADRASTMQDTGFEKNLAPESMHRLLQELHEAVHLWTKDLPE